MKNALRLPHIEAARAVESFAQNLFAGISGMASDLKVYTSLKRTTVIDVELAGYLALAQQSHSRGA